MKPAEIFFRNFKNNNIFLLRYCSGRVVVKNIPKGNAVFGIHDSVAILLSVLFSVAIYKQYEVILLPELVQEN